MKLRKVNRTRGKLDREVFAYRASRRQIVKCYNGHYNTKTAQVCWICGAWLKLTA